MASKKNDENKKNNPAGAPPLSHASKPLLIGSLIKKLADDKRIPYDQIAEKLRINKRSVYNFFTRKYLSVPRMMQLSELLEYDLFKEYRPNVPWRPDERDEELNKLRGHRDLDLELQQKNDKLSEENKRLRTENELMREMLEKRLR